MLEGLLMFFIQDALFLLGYLARGNAFPKPLSREEEAEMIERMQVPSSIMRKFIYKSGRTQSAQGRKTCP